MELLGRDGAIADIEARLQRRRLVTVTGPGGIGKTTLATAAAASLAGGYAQGWFTADLTRVDAPAGVSAAIAGQLEFADFESLVNSPGGLHALILLDNCEHVLDAAAEAATSLLGAHPGISLLATSRAPLDVVDESVLTLGPLEVPPFEPHGMSAALELFVTRAADHGVDIPDSELAAVAEICRRLDGVPLAIELAAARLRSLSATEVLAELEARPHALARPRFRGKPNHRSVADTVTWSTDLLSEEGRAFFYRLGVFSGPFTAAMATAVATDNTATAVATDSTAAGAADSAGTLDLLEELIDASLITADTRGQVTRYRLLHPIRAIALDRLEQSGDAPKVRSRWVDQVVDRAVDVILRNSDGWDGPLMEDMLALYDNMVAAIRYTLNSDDDDGRRPLTLVAVLWGVVHQNHTAEVAKLGEQVLDRWPHRDQPFWADAVATVATSRNLLGDPEGAIELASGALDHVGSSPFAGATLNRLLAQASRALGDRQAACRYFRVAAEAADSQDSSGLALELWVGHGILLAELEDRAAGLAIVEKALTDARAIGAKINEAWALVGLSVIHGMSDRRSAIETAEAALAESERINYSAGVLASYRALAVHHDELGDDRAAAVAMMGLLDELVRRCSLTDLQMALDVASRIAERQNLPQWADLAATAESLPNHSVSLADTAEVFERATGAGRILSRRQAFDVCRSAMAAVASPPDQQVPDPIDDEPLEWIRQGDTWRISFNGRTTLLRTSKGLNDLAALLANPDREIAAVDLAGAAVHDGTQDDVLDAEARRRYEARIRDLQADLDEADARNDHGTAERLGLELDALIEQLTAAVGLGGRSRTTTGTAERARSAVTQRIRSTIKRIDGEHPGLGAHLRSSITTGTYCSYRPPERTAWRIER